MLVICFNEEPRIKAMYAFVHQREAEGGGEKSNVGQPAIALQMVDENSKAATKSLASFESLFINESKFFMSQHVMHIICISHSCETFNLGMIGD